MSNQEEILDRRDERVKAVALKQARLAERGEQAFVAIEGRCKDEKKLLETVKAFLGKDVPPVADGSRPLHSGEIKTDPSKPDAGGIPRQYLVTASARGFGDKLPIGHVEIEPEGDVWYRFRIECCQTDLTGQPARDLFKALAGHLQNIYGSDDAAQAAPTAPPEGNGQRAKGGRPRNVDDDWAWAEVRDKNRAPEDVYPEWLARIGDRATTLADPRDSFSKAISPKRKNEKTD